eukprot:TRINITY_DN586_c1_g1_i1.p1 TRINITY_DN586_c1_g1~~TRINITY_DN586_c1_g1_i1.p1  ORF type:complete len:402 (-),score=84.23 TRINITY_DN586_c1_g1_i1:70-1275(-)
MTMHSSSDGPYTQVTDDHDHDNNNLHDNHHDNHHDHENHHHEHHDDHHDHHDEDYVGDRDVDIVREEKKRRKEERAAGRPERRRKKRIWKMKWCVYLCLSLAPLTFLCLLIPPTPAADWWPSWMVAYLRVPFFPWSSLVLVVLLHLVGFMFVAGVTQRRPNPLKSRKKDYTQLTKLMLVSPFLFMLAPIFTLSGSHLAWSPHDFFNGHPSQYGSSTCLSCPEFWYSFLYNYFFYSLAFAVGIHNTYLDKIRFTRHMGDKLVVPSRWKTYTKAEAIATLCTAVVVGAVMVVNATFLLREIDRSSPFYTSPLLWQLVCYAGVLVMLVVVSVVRWRTHEPHLHHYQIGLALVLMAPLHNPATAVLQAVGLGYYVEGVSRWSMASIWDARSLAPLYNMDGVMVVR